MSIQFITKIKRLMRLYKRMERVRNPIIKQWVGDKEMDAPFICNSHYSPLRQVYTYVLTQRRYSRAYEILVKYPLCSFKSVDLIPLTIWQKTGQLPDSAKAVLC